MTWKFVYAIVSTDEYLKLIKALILGSLFTFCKELAVGFKLHQSHGLSLVLGIWCNSKSTIVLMQLVILTQHYAMWIFKELQGPASRVRPGFVSGSGLSLSKCIEPISDWQTKLFYNTQSNYLFLSWRTFVVLTEVTSVSEVIVTFFSANSICEHRCLLFFSARISLTLFLRKRPWWGN